jgi:molybdate transport system substrate-binding protein
MTRSTCVGLSVILALGIATGCTAGRGAGSSAPAVEPGSPAQIALIVFAAASLKKPFAEVEVVYRTSHPGVFLSLSFGASGLLETQIEQGAPADVFASADARNPQKLAAGGFATDPVTIFAGNRLAIIVPTANRAGVTRPLDLAKPGLKVVAAGDDVPISEYADQLLDNLARQPGYPADFAARVKGNIVSQEDNAAAILAKIELGEGDAAIVYLSDATASTNVSSVAVPAEANVPATYAAVAVKRSTHAAASAEFIAWLAGPEGQAILVRHGFLPPPDR